MDCLEKQLGKALNAKEVAQYLGLDIKTVRKYYHQLGGIRLGRHYRFFGKEIINAISKRKEMDCSSEEGRSEIGKGVFDEEGSQKLGSRDEAKTLRRLEQQDRHGLFE